MNGWWHGVNDFEDASYVLIIAFCVVWFLWDVYRWFCPKQFGGDYDKD